MVLTVLIPVGCPSHESDAATFAKHPASLPASYTSGTLHAGVPLGGGFFLLIVHFFVTRILGLGTPQRTQ